MKKEEKTRSLEQIHFLSEYIRWIPNDLPQWVAISLNWNLHVISGRMLWIQTWAYSNILQVWLIYGHVEWLWSIHAIYIL